MHKNIKYWWRGEKNQKAQQASFNINMLHVFEVHAVAGIFYWGDTWGCCSCRERERSQPAGLTVLTGGITLSPVRLCWGLWCVSPVRLHWGLRCIMLSLSSVYCGVSVQLGSWRLFIPTADTTFKKKKQKKNLWSHKACCVTMATRVFQHADYDVWLLTVCEGITSLV